jgi:hypothetical protein
MAIEIINIGISANDGTGDVLRDAFIKCNENFDELDFTKQDELVSGTNIKTIEGQSLIGPGNIDLTKSDVGLGNVDNTSDLNKPISTATQTALNAKIGGSGTDNYVPRFNGTNALENSIIFDNGTNVGIGTTSPAEKLSVTGAIISTGGITGHGANRTSLSQEGSGSAYWQSYGANSLSVGEFYLRQASSDFSINRVPLFINSSGNVGIGTTSPGAKLHVVGDGIFDDNINGRITLGISASQNDIYSTTTGFGGWKNFRISSNELIFSTGGTNERMRITSSGNVVIGTLGTGLVYSNAGTLTSTNPSDERLKNNITDLNYGLNEILKLRPVTYNWKNDTINQGKQFGFIAQEVQQIMPDLITEFTTIENDEEVIRLGLDKEAIFVAMVNAIQELKSEIEILKTK